MIGQPSGPTQTNPFSSVSWDSPDFYLPDPRILLGVALNARALAALLALQGDAPAVRWQRAG